MQTVLPSSEKTCALSRVARDLFTKYWFWKTLATTW